MEIKIDREKVDEETLAEFVNALEHVRGCTITCREYTIVETADAQAAAILQTVFSSSGKKKIQDVRKEKAGGSQRKYARQEKYEVLDGVHRFEQLTGVAVGKMIREGSLVKGTNLNHPVKGTLVVHDGALIERRD